MKLSNIAPYLANAFCLLIPALAFNVLFMRYLPRNYQMDTFWNNIPAWIGIPENLLRLPVFLLPLVMRLQISTDSQRVGLGLYLAGTLVYFLAWGAQIMFPLSAWSTSMIGFMAPAFTPAVFLVGIGLIGDTLTVPKIPWTPWIYFALCGAFLIFHNLHMGLVYIRNG